MYNVNWFLFRFSNYRLNSRKYVGSCYTVSARKACYNIGLFDILCAHSRNVTNCYSVNRCWIGIDGSSFGCSYCSICTVIGMFIVQSLLCLYYQFEYKKMLHLIYRIISTDRCLFYYSVEFHFLPVYLLLRCLRLSAKNCLIRYFKIYWGLLTLALTFVNEKKNFFRLRRLSALVRTIQTLQTFT